MTKGQKTTEFWLSVGVIVLAIVLHFRGASDSVTLALIAVSQGSYALSRGLAKNRNGA
jgi:hypothetical protein